MIITCIVLFTDPLVVEELKLKISGPTEVRHNEPTQFKCSGNRNDVELDLKLNKETIKNSVGRAEFLLKPAQMEPGVRELILECQAKDENQDTITITHYIEVLCKFAYLNCETFGRTFLNFETFKAYLNFESFLNLET